MKPRRLFAALAALSLMLTTVPTAAAGNILPQREHLEISMEEIKALTFDMDVYRALAEELLSLADDPESRDTLAEKLPELREMYLIQDTVMEIQLVATYADASDTAAAQRYKDDLEDSYDTEELMGQVVSAILDGPCADLIDWNDTVYGMYTYEYSDYSRQERDLLYQEEELVDEYYLRMGEEFIVSLDGVTYTEDDIYAAYDAGTIDYDTYDELLLRLAMEQNDALAQIYVDLAEVRKKIAKLYDYDDCAAYYDDMYYCRDVTRGERSALSRAVRRYIVPLLPLLEQKLLDDSFAETVDNGFSEETLMGMMKQSIPLVSEELTPALDYMTEFGYYDIEDSPKKSDLAFTTVLPYSNAPYIFMKPSGSAYDYTTLVHEFGHYNAYFTAENTYYGNIDLAEIHSQGLELLMLKHYPTVFGDRADYEELCTVYEMLIALIDGCMMDELERFAYAEPDLTVEKINEKYMELLRDYGYRDADDPAEMAYGWVMTAHLYDYPLYYLSYGLSAAGAFSLWETSLEDYEGAVSDYLNLVALGESGTFFVTLSKAGIGNPLAESRIEALGDTLRERYALDTVEFSAVNMAFEDAEAEEAGRVVLILAGCVLFWQLLCIVILVAYDKLKRRKRL